MVVFAIRLLTRLLPTSSSTVLRQGVAYSSGLFRADTSAASRRSTTSCRRAGQVRLGLANLSRIGSSLARSHFTTPLATPAISHYVQIHAYVSTAIGHCHRLPPPERSLDRAPTVVVNRCIQYLKARLFSPTHAHPWLTRRRAQRPQAAREPATGVGNAVSRYVISCMPP
jgi:hypothetical protein